MSNYTKTTDFEAKDSLPTGDSGKIIRGAEFETEFDAISTAIATKADTAGPTFTGTATFETISDGTISVTAFVDEDDMVSDSATLVPTQQSVKAYVDSQVTAQDLDFQGDTGGALSIDLDSETLTVAGGTGIDTAGSLNTLTVNIDSTVATLTGTQTLTNKTLTSPDVNTPDIDGGTIDGTVIGGTTAAAGSFTTVSATGNITVSGTVDGRDVATDGTKLDGIEALADVTDTANVTAAGALMDSELTSEASVKALNQGVATTDSPTFAGVTVNGTVEFDGLSGTGAVSVTDILDQDDMLSNSATALATQQSIKAYVDAQVATADALSEVLGNGNTTGGTDIAVGTGDDITFADSSKAIFGAGSDLQIYHDGSNSYITDSGTGNLRISGTLLQLNDASFNKYLLGSGDSVTLYNADSAKLQTTSTGIDVTGTVVSDGLTVDASTAVVQASNAGGTTSFEISNTNGVATANNKSALYLSATGAEANAARIESDFTGTVATNHAQDLKFYYVGVSSSPTLGMTLNSSGNVGIGTSSPASELDVAGTTPTLTIKDTQNKSWTSADTTLGELAFRTSDTSGIGAHNVAFVRAVNEVTSSTTPSGALSFGISASNANASEAMRIDSAGNVGIGTQSPGVELDVVGTTDPQIRVLSSGTGASDDTILRSQIGGTTASNYLYFGDADDNNSGQIRYVHSDDSMRFYAGATTERLRLYSTASIFYNGATEIGRFASNNYFGIGTSSPAQTLHVSSTSASSNGIRISNSECSYEARVDGGEFYLYDVDDARIPLLVNTSGNVGIGTSVPTNAKLEVVASSGEVFRADASGGAYRIVANQTGVNMNGNVGIGTTTVNRKLEISGNNNAGAKANYIRITDTDTTATAANQQGGIEFYASDATGGAGVTASMEVLYAGSGGGGEITFNTAVNSGAGVTEKMRIDESGNVGIGTASPAYELDVDSTIHIGNDGGSGFTHSRLILDSNGANRAAGIFSHNQVNDTEWFFGSPYDTPDSFAINRQSTTTHADSTANKTNSLVTVDSSGNVGIATTSPSRLLDVNGIAKASIFDVDGEGFIRGDVAGELHIQSGTTATAFRNNANNAEHMRIDSSGNVLAGKSSSAFGTAGTELLADGAVTITRSGSAGGTPFFINRLSNDGELAAFYKDGTQDGSIGIGAGTFGVGNGTGNLGFFDATVVPMSNSYGGASDGVIDLGIGSRRFQDIYATNSTIQTSDRNEKQDIEELSEAEQRVAVACKGLLRKFRWKSAVEEKGDDARIHFGIIAQDLQDAFSAEGLDAGRYGMFINSTWTDEETGEERSRMGVRYSELLAFIISAI